MEPANKQHSVMEVGGRHKAPLLLEDPNTVSGSWRNVLVTVSIVVKKTMTMASLTRKTFN